MVAHGKIILEGSGDIRHLSEAEKQPEDDILSLYQSLYRVGFSICPYTMQASTCHCQ